MFKAASLFSLVFAGQGDILAPCNPTKKKNTQKGIYEAMELRCSTLQEELATLHEKVKDANSLQEEEKINDSLSTMDAQVTKLKDGHKVAEKRYMDVS